MQRMPTTLRHGPARMTIVALSISAVVALTGCTSSEADPEPPATATASAPAEPSPTATSDSVVEPVVATLPDGRGTVDVAVRSLVLDENGTTMTLRVDFTPHVVEDDGAMTLSMINDFFFIFPELLDREHLKRYSVITGEGTQDWLTNKDAKAANDETLSSWFVYAAPEDDVDSFTLTMDGWGLEIPGVEVTA